MQRAGWGSEPPPTQGVFVIRNSSPGHLLSASPQCPLTCTAGRKEKALGKDRCVVDASDPPGGPALCHTTIQRPAGHMPCPQESCVGRALPTLVCFKAQLPIVSVDIVEKDLPSAWHTAGLTVDFHGNH